MRQCHSQTTLSTLDCEPKKPPAPSSSMEPRNPNERDREILTLVAEGHTHKQAAGHLGLAHRPVTNALGRMRDRYTTPTNEALIAFAIRLQWIAVAIEIHV